MLIRADPNLGTLSTMSFPRDLMVDIHCPGRSAFPGPINSAYALCGLQGTVETVKQLTGLPINYLVTINFRGFIQIVDKLGGVWIDVDRRYFNDNSGGGPTFPPIDLQPGYQQLTAAGRSRSSATGTRTPTSTGSSGSSCSCAPSTSGSRARSSSPRSRS